MTDKYPASCPMNITDAIRAFANRLVGRDDLAFIPVEPAPWAAKGLCYRNASIAAQIYGGEPLFGFSIWTTRNLFLTAEHHCVLLLPDGKMLDPTPQLHSERQILFVPTGEAPTAENAERHLTADYHLLVDHPLIRKALTILDSESVLLVKQRRSNYVNGVEDDPRTFQRWNCAVASMEKLIDRYYQYRQQKKNKQSDKRRKKLKKQRRKRK
jgi:hypothetical protein